MHLRRERLSANFREHGRASGASIDSLPAAWRMGNLRGSLEANSMRFCEWKRSDPGEGKRVFRGWPEESASVLRERKPTLPGGRPHRDPPRLLQRFPVRAAPDIFRATSRPTGEHRDFPIDIVRSLYRRFRANTDLGRQVLRLGRKEVPELATKVG